MHRLCFPHIALGSTQAPRRTSTGLRRRTKFQGGACREFNFCWGGDRARIEGQVRLEDYLHKILQLMSPFISVISRRQPPSFIRDID